jgi:hypothetical protein
MDEDLETAKFMLDRGYIMDADLFRVAAEIKRVRERNKRLEETGSLEDE